VWCDVPLARATDPEWSRAICAIRDPWLTYSLRDEAHEAAVSDDRWRRFLDAFRSWLDATSDWCVLIEEDCDRYPLTRIAMTSEELVDHLDEHRRHPMPPLSWIVARR
jgi:hypothetical protein